MSLNYLINEKLVVLLRPFCVFYLFFTENRYYVFYKLKRKREIKMIEVKKGSYADLKQDCVLVRENVFIKEQKIDPNIELDELDATCLHFVLYKDGQAIATARFLSDGHVGRVAVLKEYRKQGYGSMVLKEIIKYAKEHNYESIFLGSQLHAVPFYLSLGFKVASDIFLEADIEHVNMILSLNGKMEADPKFELVDIVDDKNNILKVITRNEMRKNHLPHRASYIVLKNSQNKYLIEIRTLSKDYMPGMFDACIGGVMQHGEDPKTSALREFCEEVGIHENEVSFDFVGVEKIQSGDLFIMAYLYFAKGDVITKRQDSEVSGIMYLTEDEIDKLKDNFVKDSYDAFKLILKKQKEMEQ